MAKHTEQLQAAPKGQILFVAIGRQRVGKTTLLKAIAEIVRKQGGNPEIWNTDALNKSHAISSFGPDVLEPHQQTATAQAAWLEERIIALSESGRDAILDIGGGWTAMHELFHASPLLGVLRRLGISLVTAFVVGGEPADLDYLDDLHERRFIPPRAAIILNQGLLPVGADVENTFMGVVSHPAVAAVLGRGCKAAVFPSVNGLKKVAERNQTFFDFAARVPVSGLPSVSFFDSLRFDHWLRHELPLFMEQLGPDHLPHMPNGLPRSVSKEEIEMGEDA